MSMFGGLQIFQSISIPEFKEVHRQERKWSRRVMYQRYRRFDIKSERMIIMFGSGQNATATMHPNTFKALQLAVDKSKGIQK